MAVQNKAAQGDTAKPFDVSKEPWATKGFSAEESMKRSAILGTKSASNSNKKDAKNLNTMDA